MRIKDIMPWSHHTGESHHQPDKADARHSLKQDINALVDRFVEKVGSFELPWHDTEAKSDVVQADKAVEISIELPGMELEDIDLSISGDMLAVQGERKIERREEKQGYFLSERAYGQIYRAIPLPPGLDVDAAVADLKNGVLTVRIPQSAEAAASVKKIDIKKS